MEHFSTFYNQKTYTGSVCIFIAQNYSERTGNYPNKQHNNLFGNLSRACEANQPVESPTEIKPVW